MDKELSIYVSASGEMDAECELIGQLLADITKTARSTIRRTPRSPQDLTPDIDALIRSDFYIILLGADLVAPTGVEWSAARRTGVSCLAYRRAGVMPSPALSHFIRSTDLPWQEYQTPTEFARKFERDLVSRLLQETPGHGLDLQDVEELSARLERLSDQDLEQSGPETRRGAGHGGVILPHP